MTEVQGRRTHRLHQVASCNLRAPHTPLGTQLRDTQMEATTQHKVTSGRRVLPYRITTVLEAGTQGDRGGRIDAFRDSPRASHVFAHRSLTTTFLGSYYTYPTLQAGKLAQGGQVTCPDHSAETEFAPRQRGPEAHALGHHANTREG